MNVLKRAFCRVALEFDRIPRYGRLYSLMEDEPKPIWRYQKRGYWGLNMLDRMGLLFPYLAHRNPEAFRD